MRNEKQKLKAIKCVQNTYYPKVALYPKLIRIEFEDGSTADYKLLELTINQEGEDEHENIRRIPW